MRDPKIDPDALLTAEQAAAFLNIDHRTLDYYRYRNQGPPYVRVGGRIRYDMGDLRSWVRQQTVRPEPMRSMTAAGVRGRRNSGGGPA